MTPTRANGGWDSIERRLPALVSVLILSIVAVLALLAYRGLEDALAASARSHAGRAARELARLFAASTAPLEREVAALAARPAFARLPGGPAAERDSVSAALSRLANGRAAIAGAGVHTVASGQGPLLWVAGRAAESLPAEARTPSAAPDRAGTSPIRAAASAMFYDVAAPIGGDTAADPGWVVVRVWLAPQQAGRVLGGLVGPEAVVLIGSDAPDATWVDLTRAVEPPVAGGGRNAVSWRSTPYVAAEATVGTGAWRVWVGLPRAQILAPARALARRMALFGVLVLVLGAVGALLLGRHISRPISRLMRAVESIASGHYGERVAVTGRGEVARLGAAFNGMAERVEQATRDLEAQVDQLSRTFAAVNDGLLITTREGIVVRSNRAAARITGIDAPDLVGRHIGSLLQQAVAAPVEAAAAGTTEFVLTQPGGEQRMVHAQVAQFSPDRLVHTLRDVTEQRRIEERLRHAQKMEALGQLAGGVAHDFNNILTAIRGYADAVHERCTDAEMREEVEEIERAAERAGHLTRQLLAFSRRQVLQPRVLALPDVVRGVSAMLRRMIRSDITLTLDVSASDVYVRADPIQLEQILINLVVNARDALPEGGRILVQCARVDLDAAASARLSAAARPGRFAVLRVKDTGAGIPANVLPHIFEPLFTTKAPGQGTGLGLSTVHGLVQQLGGFITVASSSGAGTSFDIYLPHEAPRREPAARPAARPVPKTTSGERILVADDDPAIRRLVLHHLERNGYATLSAASGSEVLELLDQGATIDLLLTDVVLPGMSGWEIARLVAANQPDVRVLYMSGFAPGDFGGTIAAPGVAYIAKPFTPAQLISRIRGILDGVEAARAS